MSHSIYWEDRNIDCWWEIWLCGLGQVRKELCGFPWPSSWRWSTHSGHINWSSHVWNDRMALCSVKEANHSSTNVRFHLYVTPEIGTVRDTESTMVGAKGWGRRKWGVGIYWGQSFCLERWTSSRHGWWGWLLSIVNIQCHWIEHLKMIKMVKFTLCILYHNLKNH